MDPDLAPDPAIFIIDLQDVKISYSVYYILKLNLHHFKKKSHREVTKQYESRFFLTIFD